MSRRMPHTTRTLGLLAVACATGTLASARENPRPPARPPARVYTNADLERIHPLAGQTGGSSLPAVPADVSPAGDGETASRGRGEDYWRREAAAVRERLLALEERAAGLRTRIAERERAPREETIYGARRRSSSGSSSGSTSVASLRASLAAVERRIRRAQEDLEERARRDGALPGWLR